MDAPRLTIHIEQINAEDAARIAAEVGLQLREEKPKPRVLRRFVNRGGQLVEVGTVIRETR